MLVSVPHSVLTIRCTAVRAGRLVETPDLIETRWFIRSFTINHILKLANATTTDVKDVLFTFYCL